MDSQQNLLVRFRLDNQQAITAARQFSKAIADQNKAMKSTATTATAMGTGLKQTGNGMKQFKQIVGQAGFQVADFAIVMQQGQGFLKSFAIQGGQLAGAFGPMGALIGGVITVVGLFSHVILEALGASKSLDDQIKELTEDIETFAKTAEQAAKNPFEFTQDFGSTASSQITIFDLKHLLESRQALAGLQDAMGALSAEMQDGLGVTDELLNKQREMEANERALEMMYAERLVLMERNERGVQEYTDSIDRLEEQQQGIKRIMGELSDELDLTTDQYTTLATIVQQFNQASTPREYVQNMADFAAFIQESGINLAEVEGKLGESLRSMFALGAEAQTLVEVTDDLDFSTSKLAINIRSAAAQAGQFAKNMIAAADAARRAQAAALAAARAGTVDLEGQLAVSDIEVQGRKAGLDELTIALQQNRKETELRVAAMETELGYDSEKINATRAEIELQGQLNEELIRNRFELENMDEAEKELAKTRKAGGAAAKSAQTEYEKLQKKIQQETEASSVTMRDLAEAGVGGFVDAIFDADQSFSEFAENFLRTIAKMILQQMLLNSISRWFGGGDGGTVVAGVSDTALAAANVVPHAKGGIIGAPTMFPMGGNKMGLMAESGPEAIMPLSRSSDGTLGVAGPNITINNHTGQEVTVDNQQEMITIAVGEARRAVENDFSRSMTSGQGVYARGLESGYRAGRRVK